MSKQNNKNPNLLTLKESRAIIKSNLREMKRFEKMKREKKTPDQFTTTMRSNDNVLEIEDLETYFFTDNGVVRSVNKISFEVPKDSIVGLVGESGCGKSVTSLSIMQLVQAPQGQVVGGEIRFNAEDELGQDENGKARCYDITKMPTVDMLALEQEFVSRDLKLIVSCNYRCECTLARAIRTHYGVYLTRLYLEVDTSKYLFTIYRCVKIFNL